MRKARNGQRRRADRRRPTTLSNAEFSRLLLTAPESTSETSTAFQPGIFGRHSVHEALAGQHPNGTAGLREIADRASDHRFDLLGSGWIKIDYYAACPGAFGHRYEMSAGKSAESEQLARMTQLLDESALHVGDDSPGLEQLREAIAGDEYRPIDWHLDFKSGYRWDPATWHMDVPFGDLGGVDIKVPWELSRGHHLVTLALDSVSGDGQGPDHSREISLQLLDWITANPPRFGVNWRTTMEVGIRASNWVWALSILGESPGVPPAIRWLVSKSLYQHGVHIYDHLEYQADYTSNHYLANIVGLMHIGIAFPEFPESSRWLAFCLEELVSEMRRTVYPDGVNYECSTGYHRLVTEMFLHGGLLALRLTPEQRTALTPLTSPGSGKHPPGESEGFDPGSDTVLPAWFWLRLSRMLGYVSDVTKPSGLALQFGDQDSGRFLKLSWIGRASGGGEPAEEPRDHRHLLAIGGRVFDNSEWADAGRVYDLDGFLSTRGIDQLPLRVHEDSTDSRQSITAPDEPDSPNSVWYPFGGTCVMRRGSIWVGVRCVPAESKGPGGHRHNDQLSFELNVDGQDLVTDWGTGVYTADSSVRNSYRSTASHSTAFPRGQEQNSIVAGRAGVFVLRDGTRGGCVEVGAAKFVGEHRGFNVPHTRTFSLRDDALVVEDSLDVPGGFVVALTLAEGVRVDDDRNESGGRLKLRQGAVEVVVESTATELQADKEALSSGYGVFDEAWALRFTAHSGNASMTISPVTKPDPGSRPS